MRKCCVFRALNFAAGRNWGKTWRFSCRLELIKKSWPFGADANNFSLESGCSGQVFKPDVAEISSVQAAAGCCCCGGGFFNLGVSKNNGIPKIIHFNRVFHYFHHPFWGTLIFGNTHYLNVELLDRHPDVILHEEIWPKSCPNGFRITIFGGYVYVGRGL